MTAWRLAPVDPDEQEAPRGEEAKAKRHDGVFCHTTLPARVAPPRARAHNAPMSRRASAVVVALGALVDVGCSHAVAITSNVPEAQVRVDGERKGSVKDGAHFVERGGLATEYDVDVSAPGYRTERRLLRPSLGHSGVGVPATAAIFCGSTGLCCVSPTALLVSLVVEGDTPAEEEANRNTAYAVAAGAATSSLAAIAAAAWGVQQLPDEVYVELDPDGEGAPDGSMLP